MADINLTLTEIENLFHGITARIFGYDIDNQDPAVANVAKAAAGKDIRISWPTGGAPGWKITDNQTFIRVVFDDDEYTKQREFSYTRKTDLLANQTMEMTNVIKIYWAVYGPNSYNRAFKLFTQLPDPKITLFTAQNKIYLIPEIPSPRRVPELRAGQWWERMDISARFNAKVKITTEIPYLLSTEISVETEEGEIEIVDIRSEIQR